MARSILPVMALILGSSFLMLAGGINGLILPLRGHAEGFTAFSLGLLGTGWALGYMAGCIFTPRLVQRAGHIRTFSALASLAAIAVLLSLLIPHPVAWIPLRAISGFCFSGAAMIFESWLNERTEERNRGRVFGTYMMVNLVATTLGQMMITLGDKSGFLLFVLAGIFYAMAVLPPALTRIRAPAPLTRVKLDVGELMRNSPFATISIVLVGVSNGAFGALGAVYGEQLRLDTTTIALFMSLSLLAGAIIQLPVGYWSDSCDRRLVLMWIAGIAGIADLYFLVFSPSSPWLILIAGSIFGAAIYSMYPVIVSHAYDRALPADYIQISGGLLLLFGAGAAAGPLVAGLLMGISGKSGLFIITLIAHAAIIGCGFSRRHKRQTPPGEYKEEFAPVLVGALSTPELANLDPRTPDRQDRDGNEKA